MTEPVGPRTPMYEYDYDLPSRLIAQTPLKRRSASRLLVLDRESNDIEHRRFEDLPGLLRPGDVIVVNDSRVIPARLVGMRQTGGSVEILLLREERPGLWRALIRPAKRIHCGEEILIHGRQRESDLPSSAVIKEKFTDGEALVQLDERLSEKLGEFGRVPLPPYISEQLEDDERYQTMFASHPGSAAAPTAGLHFTDDAVHELEERGIRVARVTLHVGLDTFRPVSEEFAEDHVIHKEWCSVPPETAKEIRNAKDRTHRIVAVGTTVARTLESYAESTNYKRSEAFSGMTGIFITPEHSWKLVDAIITNFHLPRSTLLLMISSFVGRERLLRAYHEAIAEEYRFFSFGDAMLIV